MGFVMENCRDTPIVPGDVGDGILASTVLNGSIICTVGADDFGPHVAAFNTMRCPGRNR